MRRQTDFMLKREVEPIDPDEGMNTEAPRDDKCLQPIDLATLGLANG